MSSYYRILGVPEGAANSDIKTAYRRLARKFHPDHNGGHALAEHRFRLLAEAYEVLGDDEQRRKYDRFGAQGLVRGRGRRGVVGGMERFVANLESIVESRLKQMPRRGDDRRRPLPVRLEDACYGGSIEIEVIRREACGACGGNGALPDTQIETCHVCGGSGRFSRGTLLKTTDPCLFCQGAGQLAVAPCGDCDGAGEVDLQRSVSVEVPAGVQSGRRLILRGYGGAGQAGGAAGDLLLDVEVQPDSWLSRQGNDLHCTVPITLKEAVTGGTVSIPVLRGEPVTIRIPKRSNSGQTLRLKGRGAPRPGGGAGDLMVRLEVETPELSGTRAEALLEELDALSRHPRREALERSLE